MPFVNMFGKQKEAALVQLALAGMTTVNVADGAMILRRRCTIAEINAGVALLPAITGFHYRLHDMSMLAVGGAVGATTTVDITGTQGGSTVKLLAVAIAALTQSALVRAGAANAVILADGASFNDLDTNTGINAGKTGATATTATHVDIQITFDVIGDY